MAQIEVVGMEEVVASFDRMPAKLHNELLKAITVLALQLESHVKQDKLEGQVLNHITGRLQGSIHSETTDNGNSIIGRVYSSGCDYAAIHEYGFQGTESVREHIRTHVFGREVDPFVVPAHMRQMNMPERSFLRSSLHDFEEKIVESIEDAIARGIAP